MKKKILTIFLILGLLVQMFPAQKPQAEDMLGGSVAATYVNPLYQDVIAEDNLNQSVMMFRMAEVEYYDTVSQAADYLREELENRADVITVGIVTENMSEEIFYTVFEEALVHTGVSTEGDYLRLQYGGWSANSTWYTIDGVYYATLTYTMTYFTTAEQEEELDAAVTALLNELNLYEENEYEKITGIYEYICDNVVYDFDNLDDESHMLKYTAYAALINETSVCQGYANLFYRLALELGVDVRSIIGDAEGPHSWNIVQLGDLYYNVDATWDAASGKPYHYFLLCQNSFEDHIRDEAYVTEEFHAMYPMSETDYTYSEPSDVKVPEKPYKITNVVSGVHVYWNAVKGVEKYGVWRSETGKNGTYEWLGNPADTHFTDGEAESGKTYFYRISAVIPGTNKHTEKSEAIGIVYVSTPDIQERCNQKDGVFLSWDKVDGATGYAIYRKSYAGTDGWARVGTIEGNTTFSWTDTSVAEKNGTVYRYTIRALAGSDLKTLSGCRNTGRTMVRLTRRTLESVVAEGTSVKSSWDISSQVTGYEVRLTDAAGKVTMITIEGYGIGTGTITGLAEETKYTVEVRSYKNVDKVGMFYSAWSEPAEVTTGITATIEVPEKPYKAANIVNGARIYWKAVEGIEKYGVWRSENGKNGTYEWCGNPTVTNYADTKAESGKTYFYKITAMDPETGVHSEKSDAIGITYVSTPDITGRENVKEGIALSWNEVDGANGYAVYRKSYNGTDEWVRIATVEGNETFTWTDTSVAEKNGAIYRYTVRALAGSDLKTLSGCRNTGRTMMRLSERTLNSVIATGQNSVKCSWSTTAKATGYEVRFTDRSGKEKTFVVGNYKTGVKTFNDLAAGAEYSVNVRSYKKLDDVGTFYSEWSVTMDVTTPAKPTSTPTPTPIPTDSKYFEWKENEDGTLTITGWTGGGMSKAVIPSEIKGKKVTVIGRELFFGNGSIQNVILPDTIIKIEENAFCCCGIKDIYISSSVVNIEAGNFSSCDNLTSLHIPASVESFSMEQGNQVSLRGSDFIEKITVDENNKVYKDVDGILYSKDMTTLITVPDAWKGVVEIPESVTTTISGAFNGCHSVTGIVIPATTDYFEEGYTAILYGLSSLEGYTVDEDHKYLKSVNGALVSKDGTKLVHVPNLVAGTSYDIPDTVEVIFDCAFSDCIELKTIEVPATMEFYTHEWVAMGDRTYYDVPYNIFYHGEALSSIEVKEGSIAYTSADGMLFSADKTVLVGIPGSTENSDYKVPEGVTQIAMDAHKYGYGLKSISLPASLNTIFGSAFMESELEKVTFSKGIEHIGGYAFYATNLTSVKLPEGLLTLDSNAFCCCYELGEVVIPATLKRIGSNAFAYCYALKSLVIPEGMESIGSDAFYRCTGLTEVKLPNSLTTIEENPFEGCENLKTIHAPVGSYAEKWATQNGYKVINY